MGTKVRQLAGRAGDLASICDDLQMAIEERAQSPRRPDGDDRPELLIKLQERKARHKERHILHRAAIVVLGALLIPLGIVMSGPGIPGPGFLVLLLGISFLALEFDRAERILERVIIWADRAKDRVEASSRGEKIVAGIAIALVVAGCVAACLLWDIPLLPV